MAWLDDVQGFLNDLVGFLQVIAPFLPALMMLGPFSFGIGLVIFVQILMLVLMVLLGIALVLALLIDDFQHYLDDNPTEDAPDEHPDELTESPEEECSIGDAPQTNTQMIMQIVFLSGGTSVSTINALLACVGSGLSLSEIGLDDIWDVIQDGLQGGKYILCIFDCAVSLPGELFPHTNQLIPVIAIAVGVGMCFGMKMIRACYGLALVAAVYASFCVYCARTNNCLKHLDRPIAWPFA